MVDYEMKYRLNVLLLSVLVFPLWADNNNEILGIEKTQSLGITAINTASGDHMIQFNGVSIALSNHGDAVASIDSKQAIDQPTEYLSNDTNTSSIGTRAFESSIGILLINQASGIGNLQANGVAIAVGLEGYAMADIDLEQTVSGPELMFDDKERIGPKASAFVDSTALQGTTGVVQVNQAAGSWNATANSFTLQINM